MESFSEACKNSQIRFRLLGVGLFTWTPTRALPWTHRGLHGPLDPRPNVLFSKMTLLFHFIMKNLDLSPANAFIAVLIIVSFNPYHTIMTLTTLYQLTFSKHCGKRRKCWQPAFSPFPTMFSSLQETTVKF